MRRSVDWIVYNLSSVPSARIALTPVSFGASLTGVIDNDWLAFIVPPFESETK